MPSLVSLAGKGLIGLLSTVAASLTALTKSVANFPKTLRWHHWGMLLLPFAFFLLALQYTKDISYNDPTSPYFNPARGYAKIYSSVRQREATEFIQKHNSTDAAPFRRKSAHVPPFICVGMNKERNQLYIAPMIGHINATTHPIYTEPWLEKVADKVMTYQTMDVVSEERLKHIEELELTRQRTGEPDREKHMGDYTLLLMQCDATGAPYVLMLEDDILFLDGWFHRLRQGIVDVEEQSKGDEGGCKFCFPSLPPHRNDVANPYLLFLLGYNLRLFYLEYGFYWHLSEVVTTGVAIVAFCVVAMGLIWLSIRGTRWYRRTTRQTRRVLFLTGILGTIACVLLYLTLGHLTVAHMLRTPSVARRGGCCFQGILWPHDKVEPVTEFYTKERIGFVDSLAERLVNGGGLGHQWALVPTAVQHIGGKSSKGDNWGSDKPGKMSEAQRLWNFSFEWNKADKLAEEHRQAAEAFEQEKVTGDD
jgi:hypothetical protein